MDLALLAGPLAVCRLAAGDPLPPWAWTGDLVSISRARGELSVVCAQEGVPDEVTAERGWRALVVTTPMDFGTVGVAAALTSVLASAGVSVLPIATHDTDYLLVKQARLAEAVEALRGAGHAVDAA